MKPPLFYAIVGSFIATTTIAFAFHDEIRAHLKPTFEINTPSGHATILTPWGKDIPLPEQEHIVRQKIPKPRATEQVEQQTKMEATEKSKTEIRKCEQEGRTTYQNMPCDQQ